MAIYDAICETTSTTDI